MYYCKVKIYKLGYVMLVTLEIVTQLVITPEIKSRIVCMSWNFALAKLDISVSIFIIVISEAK